MNFLNLDINKLYLGPGGTKDYFKKQKMKISKSVPIEENKKVNKKINFFNYFKFENREPVYESKNVTFPNIFVNNVFDKNSKSYIKKLVVKTPEKLKDSNSKDIELDFDLENNKDIIVKCEDDDIRLILSDDIGVLKGTIEWEVFPNDVITYSHIKRWYKLVEAFIYGIQEYCEFIYKREDYGYGETEYEGDEDEYNVDDYEYFDYDYDDDEDYYDSEEEYENTQQGHFVAPLGKKMF